MHKHELAELVNVEYYALIFHIFDINESKERNGNRNEKCCHVIINPLEISHNKQTE